MRTHSRVVMAVLLGLDAMAMAMAGALSLDRGVISAGGGDALATGYGVGATIGQPVVQTVLKSESALAGRTGYWTQLLRWVNALPVAMEDEVERQPGQSTRVPAAELLLNDSDGDRDVLQVVSVDSVSVGGGSVSLEGSSVVYVPAAGPEVEDSFHYQVTDGFGGFASGTVRVRVAAGTIALEIRLPAGLPEQVEVRFQGIAGRSYQVQTAAEVLGPWATVRTLTAEGGVELAFVGSSAGEPRFFRILAP